jgi:hypothetical protein
MMIARTPENSWSELITSVCLTKAKVVSGVRRVSPMHRECHSKFR